MNQKPIWTVVGMWEGDRQTWVEYGRGNNHDEAITDAVSALEDVGADLDDLSIIAAFPGQHIDAMENIGPVSATEFEGVSDEKRSSSPRAKREEPKTCDLCGIQYIGTEQMHKFDCPSQSKHAQAAKCDCEECQDCRRILDGRNDR